jgi:transforming growth factor-beta-induced protein
MRTARSLALSLLIALSGAVALTGCDGAEDDATPGLGGLLEGRETFATLQDALEATGLAAELEAGGPYTLLAPTDQAFRLLGAGTLAMLEAPEHRDVLEKVLRAHIVPRALTVDELQDGDVVTTLGGAGLEVRVERGRVRVGGLEVRRALEFTNGLAYAVERVHLDHLSIADRLEVSGLLHSARRMLAESGVLERLGEAGPYTLLVPLDDSFGNLGAGVFDRLLANPSIRDRVAGSHLVEGVYDTERIADGLSVRSASGAELTFEVGPSALSVDGVPILLPDIRTSNGVIHLLGGVLTSDLGLNEAATLAGLSAWLDAARAVGFDEVLDGAGPYTVFAPTNAAFAQAGGAFQVEFMRSEGLLERVLAFHVAQGIFTEDDLRSQTWIPTVEGEDLRVFWSNEQAIVGLDLFAEVRRQGAIVARNGVIQPVNRVVHPRLNLLEGLVFNGFVRFVRGIHVAGLREDYAAGGPLTVFAFTDDAFNADPELAALLDPSRVDQLRDYLGYHTAEGDFPYEELVLRGGGQLPTRHGAPLFFSAGAEVLVGTEEERVGAVPVLTNPSNGALYRLDGVLTPPEE